MDTKGLIFGLCAVGLGLWFIDKKIKENKEEERRENEDVNEITNNIDDNDTRIALALKQLMNVNDNYNIWTVKSFEINFNDSDMIKMFNTALLITNWAKVQRDFLKLCKNEKNLTECLQEAFKYVPEYQQFFLDIARSKKLITTKETGAQLWKITDAAHPTIRNFEANTILGRYTGDATGKLFINEYFDDSIFSFDPQVVKGEVPLNAVKIIDPLNP